MRLAFWRKDERKQVSEATLSRQRAEENLQRTQEETAYYAALAESLRDLREANHLTQLFFNNRIPRGQQ